MITLNALKSVNITAMNPAGQLEQRSVFLHEIIRDVVLSDDRFGLDIDRLRIAAAIHASLEAAVSGNGTCTLDDKQYALVREATEKPSKPYNAALARQILPLLEHIISAGTQGTKSSP